MNAGIRSSRIPRLFMAPRLAMPALAPAPASTAAVPAARDQPAGATVRPVPRVLHIDADTAAARSLRALLAPEARLIHAASAADGLRLLQSEIFSLVVLDPDLPDGDGARLLRALAATPLLVYAASRPEWREPGAFLSKQWSSPRQLWGTISVLLGIAHTLGAGG